MDYQAQIVDHIADAYRQGTPIGNKICFPMFDYYGTLAWPIIPAYWRLEEPHREQAIRRAAREQADSYLRVTA